MLVALGCLTFGAALGILWNERRYALSLHQLQVEIQRHLNATQRNNYEHEQLIVAQERLAIAQEKTRQECAWYKRMARLHGEARMILAARSVPEEAAP